jgi:hypothetical protein
MTYEQNIDVYTKEGELVRRFKVSDQGTEHFVPVQNKEEVGEEIEDEQ